MRERERGRGRGRERKLMRTEIEGRVSSARRVERPVITRDAQGRIRREEERETRETREYPRGRTRSSRSSARSARPMAQPVASPAEEPVPSASSETTQPENGSDNAHRSTSPRTFRGAPNRSPRRRPV